MGVHDPRCQKRPKNHRILFQKVSEIDAIKAPVKQKNVGKRRAGSKSRKNDHEAKTYQFGSHLGDILVSSWGTWEAFGGHVGPRSGSPAALEPTEALPNPFLVASGPAKLPFVPYKTQHRPQKGSQTSNLDLHNPQLGPQKTSTWLQKAPSQDPNPTAQARRNGA